jgi:hypothetical protein
MATGRGKKREQQLEQKADAQIAAWQPSPLEQQQTARTQKFLTDWDSGKDVGEIDALRPYMNLYNSSVNREQDERGIGAMGFNDMTGGNGNMAAMVGEQLKARRQQQASGQLYNAANAAHADATGNQAQFLMGLSENRAAGKAGLVNNQLSAYYGRQKKPSIWETILGGAAQVGAAYVGGM